MSGGEPEREPMYGPTALATPANFVTVARILATPIFIVMVARNEPSWATFAVGFVIGITDFVDGYLARRHGETRSGAFLDPLADKVLVLGGFVALVANGQFHWAPVTIIAVRELAISAYRSRAGRLGITVPATKLAKSLSGHCLPGIPLPRGVPKSTLRLPFSAKKAQMVESPG